MNTITENNKLIALFMGAVYDNHDQPNKFWEFYDECGAHPSAAYPQDKDLKYHTSWDWLMPVIEKCRERQLFGGQRLISNIDKRLLSLDLLSTYRNVVDFINWFNENSINHDPNDLGSIDAEYDYNRD